MKALLTAIVTFVAMSASLSSANVQGMAYPRDQAKETIAKVSAALSAHPGLQCSSTSELTNKEKESLSLGEILNAATSVIRLRSSLPTYEFVRSRGSLSQAAAIVTLSEDGKSLLSAVVVKSELVDLPSMIGPFNTQLVPTIVIHCK